MNELIIATIIGWAITKVLDKKAAQAPAPSGQLAPGYSQKLGKVIGKWPSVVPGTAGEFNKLFSSDENYIGPGALCVWPQKFMVRDMILKSFIYENQLVAQYQQLSPVDRDSRQGDDLLNQISGQKKVRKDLYNNLVTACEAGLPKTGAPVVTAASQKIVAP